MDDVVLLYMSSSLAMVPLSGAVLAGLVEHAMHNEPAVSHPEPSDDDFVIHTFRVALSDAAEIVGWKHPKRAGVSLAIMAVAIVLMLGFKETEEVYDEVLWWIVHGLFAAAIVYVPVALWRLAIVNPIAFVRRACEETQRARMERDRACAAIHNDVDALESIRDSLTTLMQRRDTSKGVVLIDTTTIAGKLLLKALQHGLFAEPRFIELREVIEISMSGEFQYQRGQELAREDGVSQSTVPPPAWHAFINAVEWIDNHERRAHRPYSLEKVRDGLEWVATQIVERVAVEKAKLSSASRQYKHPNAQ